MKLIAAGGGASIVMPSHIGDNESIQTVIDISKGVYQGWETIHLHGFSTNLTSTYSDIWSPGGNHTYLTAASSSMKIASSSASDTSSGTGAKKVRVGGLDGNWNRITEEFILTGQTAVSSAKSWLRVLYMEVLEMGSASTINSFNVGNISFGQGTFTAGVPSELHARIGAGNNRSLFSGYTIPANHEGFIFWKAISSDKNDNVHFQTLFRFNSISEPWHVHNQEILYQRSTSIPFRIPEYLPEKTDIRFRARMANGTGGAAAHTILILRYAG